MTPQALERKVLAEVARFEGALPELLETLAGKWVVFLGGQVRSSHDTEADAVAAAEAELNAEDGFVITIVETRRTVPLTAAVFFG